MKKIIVILAFSAASMSLKAQNSPFGIGTYNPNALLHIHQTEPEDDPVLPPLLSGEGNRDHFFNDNYLTTLLFTNRNTDSMATDGFLMKQDNLDMYFIQREDGRIEFKTPGGKMVLSSAGYFGFGDTIATHRFNVQGTARFGADVKMTQSLTVDGTMFTNALSVGGTLNTTGSLTVGSASSLGNLAVHGNTSLEFGLTVGGATNLQGALTVYNHAIVGSTLTVGGATTVNGTFSVGTGLFCDATGNMKVKHLKVTLVDWPDYVFSGSHTLMPLGELEAYVGEHSHLPGVPTATEIEEGGADLGEMNKVLMEKVEELTLYIIDLQKQIDELKFNR